MHPRDDVVAGLVHREDAQKRKREPQRIQRRAQIRLILIRINAGHARERSDEPEARAAPFPRRDRRFFHVQRRLVKGLAYVDLVGAGLAVATDDQQVLGAAGEVGVHVAFFAVCARTPTGVVHVVVRRTLIVVLLVGD